MRLLFFIFFVATLTASCGNNASSEQKIDTTVVQNNSSNETDSNKTHYTNHPGVDVSGCYWKILKRDTFAIHLNQKGNTVSGKLSFDNFEKDASSGTVTGTINGIIIQLIYSFASEGMNSVMEVYFKKDSGQLLRGIGNMDVKNDTSFFTDPNAIVYTPDQAFNQIPCEDLPAKFK